MPIALVVDGQIKEERSLALSDVPEHKRALWRPIEGDRPDFDPATQVCTGPVFQIEADRVLRVWTVTDRDLAVVKLEFCAEIDAEAESERLKVITPGGGQALTYKEKAAEAARHLATDGTGAYPFLQAMVTAGRAQTIVAARDMVLQAEAAWAQIGSQIEAKREGGKIAVMAAQTVDAARAAKAAVVW